MAACGDGFVCPEGGEQCDDGGTDPAGNCDRCQYIEFLRVSVSSQAYSATEVFPTDADALCQQLDSVHYPMSTFFAWIGSAEFDPRDPIVGARGSISRMSAPMAG
ncbi:hypothetical protein SAMN02745121_02590 [Nannocystis exedens]|uniref:DUF4215 domain-containing protein n=1 Tax=Nannocystis exedens TaxID=54 RepID=A0A1I1WWX7_9BACT|nr:hypothetical protein [Nannocystis exedens]PCC70943.1 hypothetical protein NAEX_04009 [Nannocystis exedens]SFD99694.1 hypothetical protein SAMN02745121_02590 [Nannocystis exedens]